MLKVLLLSAAILAAFALVEILGGIFATAIGVIFFAGGLTLLGFLLYWFLKQI